MYTIQDAPMTTGRFGRPSKSRAENKRYVCFMDVGSEIKPTNKKKKIFTICAK